MAPLTADQITALTRRGGNRWRKKNMDRIYLQIQSLDCFTTKRDGDETRVYLDGDEVESRSVNDFLATKVWVDVATGNVSVSVPWVFTHSGNPKDEKMAERITTIFGESAKSYLAEVLSVARQEAEERRSGSISSAVLSWEKGTVVSIDGRDFIVERNAPLKIPTGGKATRLIIPLFDGTYRRVELTEVGDGFVDDDG